MLDVIEHLTDPMATLGLAYSALNPGGVMLIVTGDHGSLLSKVMKANWRLMTPRSTLFLYLENTTGHGREGGFYGQVGYSALEDRTTGITVLSGGQKNRPTRPGIGKHQQLWYPDQSV